MIDRTGLAPPLSLPPAGGRVAFEDAQPLPRAALSALRRHAGAALLCAALVPAATAIALDQLTPRWSAAGSLLYAPPDYNLQELQSILRADTTTDAIMASQAEIVRGLPAAEKLVERLGLADRAEFNRALQPPSVFARLRAALSGPPAPPDPARVRESVVQTALAHVTVKPLRASRVMEVTFATEDRALAADAANLVMALYIDGGLETKFEAVRRAARWLDARVAELRAEVAEAEDRIAAYRAAHGLVQGVQAGLGTERISRISADLAQARNELSQAAARLDAARGRAGDAAFAAISPSVVALRAQAEQQRAALESMLTRFGPRHPDVIASRRKLADAERATGAEAARVAGAAAAEAAADRARVGSLEQALRGAQAQTERDALAQVPLNAMQRDADAARTLLQTVLERVQQTAQQTAIETPDARVISQALPPSRPSFPPSAILLAASTAIGLLLAGTLVHLLELGDDTLRGGADARRRLGLPCLALIPELPRRLRRPSAAAGYVTERPLSPYAEQVRALRAGLWLEPVPERGRAKLVAITAARPSEGKTTLAAALGRSAAMAGERVLVIDCDVREPALSRLMGAAANAGLMDVLAGAARLDDVIGRDPLTSMRYLPAGSPPANSMQQLASDGMAAALSSLRDHYELILMDAPPACGVADGRIVAGLADSTVLCVRWRHTPARSAVHALELLRAARARVAGVALTRLDPRVHGRAGLADSDVYHPRYGGYFRE
jgi:capsular exopolysaccharide synthesis family protein